MNHSTGIWIGIDVHQDSFSVACFRGWADEAAWIKRLPSEPAKLRRLLAREASLGPVSCVYEASCCGYVLARQLRAWGFPCEVAAPSRIPRQSGERIKTDKRDALKLARLFRARTLECVRIPSEEEERVRTLVRTRDAVRRDVHRSRQRILKLLLARGLVYRDGKNWTQGFWRWLRNLGLEGDDQVSLEHLIGLLEVQLEMLESLDRRVEARSLEAPYAEVVARLRCVRGIDTLSAMTLATEIIDMRRFASPRKLMGWLGLGVCESSSGNGRKQWTITKTGNKRCRRILTEAAWNNTKAPYRSKVLRARSEGQPPLVLAHAWRAQKRLHHKWRRLHLKVGRSKTATAMARELAGFIWALWLAEPELLCRSA